MIAQGVHNRKDRTTKNYTDCCSACALHTGTITTLLSMPRDMNTSRMQPRLDCIRPTPRMQQGICGAYSYLGKPPQALVSFVSSDDAESLTAHSRCRNTTLRIGIDPMPEPTRSKTRRNRSAKQSYSVHESSVCCIIVSSSLSGITILHQRKQPLEIVISCVSHGDTCFGNTFKYPGKSPGLLVSRIPSPR